jgi:hypothetical protein
MSWNLSIDKCPRDEFEANVDAAPVPTQGDGGEQAEQRVGEDVAKAKDLLKHFASRTTSPFLSGHASGHSLIDGQEPSYHNGISVAVGSHTE